MSVASVQQLTTDATAIGKLQNANLPPCCSQSMIRPRMFKPGCRRWLQDAGEIASITASDGSIVVSAATFLADQSTLDKIVGGFDVSDTAANLMADLDQLDDPNISAITISDSGQISASVAQLTTDATAIGNLQNAELFPRAARNQRYGWGCSSRLVDAGCGYGRDRLYHRVRLGRSSFRRPHSWPISRRSTRSSAGIDVADDGGQCRGGPPDPQRRFRRGRALRLTIGDATLSGGVGVNAPIFSESGFGTSLTVSEALAYGGAFSQGMGSRTSISSGDTLSLTGTASLSGTTSGAGTLALAGGSATIDSGATISVSKWLISGAGTDVTLDESLSYAGSFSEGAGDTFVLSGGNLLLSGAATFAGGTVDGSNFLYTEGTTTVSGLTIGGTVEWENTNTVNESGGSATIGDANGDEAFLLNTPKANLRHSRQQRDWAGQLRRPRISTTPG